MRKQHRILINRGKTGKETKSSKNMIKKKGEEVRAIIIEMLDATLISTTFYSNFQKESSDIWKSPTGESDVYF